MNCWFWSSSCLLIKAFTDFCWLNLLWFGDDRNNIGDIRVSLCVWLFWFIWLYYCWLNIGCWLFVFFDIWMILYCWYHGSICGALRIYCRVWSPICSSCLSKFRCCHRGIFCAVSSLDLFYFLWVWFVHLLLCRHLFCLFKRATLIKILWKLRLWLNLNSQLLTKPFSSWRPSLCIWILRSFFLAFLFKVVLVVFHVKALSSLMR